MTQKRMILSMLFLLVLAVAAAGCSEKANSYTALDRQIDFGNQGYDSLYAIPVKAGDVLEVTATTDGVASFYCLQPEGFDALLRHDKATAGNCIVQDFTKLNTNSYQQEVTCDADGFFCLAVLPNDQNTQGGQIKVIRQSDSDVPLNAGFSATELLQKYSASSASSSADTGSSVYTTGHYTGSAYALAEKMRREAQEAQDTYDEWKKEDIKDDFTY